MMVLMPLKTSIHSVHRRILLIPKVVLGFRWDEEFVGVYRL